MSTCDLKLQILLIAKGKYVFKQKCPSKIIINEFEVVNTD